MLMQEFKTKDIARVNREAGREEGREIGIISVARNALQMNMSIDDIRKLTSLTNKEIEDLRNLK